MATLILDRSDLEIRMDGDALALYEPAGRRGTVPLHHFVLREEQMFNSASHPRTDCTHPAAAVLRHGLQYGSAEI